MASIELNVPAEARTYIMDKTTEKVRSALLLYPSIANDTISHGRAAELLGISKMELIELYGSMESRVDLPMVHIWKLLRIC